MAEYGIPNFLLHKALKILPETVKIDLFRTLEINQNFKKSKECLFKKSD